jgi:small subunit ribosomal protein S11
MGKKRIIEQNKEDLLKEKEKIDTKIKKEVKTTAKRVKEGKVFIFSSYNNTILTLTDPQGNVLGWASAGSIGFKGTKKGTPFAASKVAGVILQIIKKLGIEQISLLVKGIGAGRDSAIKSLAQAITRNEGLNIISIKERTSLPHGGCRPPKPRRV